MDMRRVVSLRHVGTDRVVPLSTKTVVGRSQTYYRYRDGDVNAERLSPTEATTLEQLDYIAIDDDKKISRIHGYIDPSGPHLSDLRTTNGTYLNGRVVPTFVGVDAPGSRLTNGDRLVMGQQSFEVSVDYLSMCDSLAMVRRRRHALVIADQPGPRLGAAMGFARRLRERKHFQTLVVTLGRDVVNGMGDLLSGAHEDGVTLVALHAAVEGTHVSTTLGKTSFLEIVGRVSQLPGRKLLVLDADGDPTACERIFAAHATREMALFTTPSARPSDFGLEPAPRGTFESTIEVVEATIADDSNRLDFTPLPGYTGRVSVTFGRGSVGDHRNLEHSLRLGTTFFRLGR